MDKSKHFYTHKVSYYETDGMGVTHHSNYIRFMEEARVDYLDQIGYSYKKMLEEGVISPVIAVHCDFKSPTRFADEILIEVSFKQYSGVKFIFEYHMTNKQTGAVVLIGQTEHCFTNEEGRPIIIKKKFPEMHEFFSKLIVKWKYFIYIK